jgi:hypothetical protein
MDEFNYSADELLGPLPEFAPELIVHPGCTPVVHAAVVVLDSEAQSADGPRLRLALHDQGVPAVGLRLIDAGAYCLDFRVGLDLRCSGSFGGEGSSWEGDRDP